MRYDTRTYWKGQQITSKEIVSHFVRFTFDTTTSNHRVLVEAKYPFAHVLLMHRSSAILSSSLRLAIHCLSDNISFIISPYLNTTVMTKISLLRVVVDKDQCKNTNSYFLVDCHFPYKCVITFRENNLACT